MRIGFGRVPPTTAARTTAAPVLGPTTRPNPEPPPTPEPATPALERRPIGTERDDTCRCDGEDVVQFHLMRVLHGPTPAVASIELTRACSGRDFDARLLDFDGDGRVELRLDLGYTGWESCGVNTKETTRLFVFDVADLLLEANVVLRDYAVTYEDEELRETRARFLDLDEDGDKDLELRGLGTSIESHEESRHPIRELWHYDAAMDRWTE